MNKNNQMSVVIEAREKVAKDFEKVQPVAAMKVMARALENIYKEMTLSRSAYMRIENGDFSELCNVEKIIPSEVEDVDQFNALVVKVAKEKSNLTRMAMCQTIMEEIRAAIERWQSKVDKFAAMSMGDGNSQGEMTTAMVKTESFKHVIEKLRERGEVISTAHDRARRSIEQALKRDAKNWIGMYVNERV